MRFNFRKRNENAATNYEGAKAYAMTPESELYAAVVTASLSDNFYEKAGDRVASIGELVSKTDAEFVARLAVYARTRMNMRSVPLVLAVELARRNSGNTIVSKVVSGVVKRADEITELLAYYQAANKREGVKKLNRLSKQVQKGLAHSFNTFDEYQFAKYNRPADVKLRDALFLVHPKARDEAQQELFNKIAGDRLEVPYTWETELSAAGRVAYETKELKTAAVRAKWEELIDSERMGYMATLRNLRNMVQAEVSSNHIEKICTYLANEQTAAGSKQLPFRFLAAYREVQGLKPRYVAALLSALEKAVVSSAANIKGFDGDTSVVIVCDVSGSMQKAISAKSKVQLFDIGLVLGMLLQSRCKNVVTGMFGETWKVIDMPAQQVLANAQEFRRREGEVGYATNGHLVIDDLISRKVQADKVMMFTDCQMWDNAQAGASLQRSWSAYAAMCPEASLYLFDLAGYGTTPIDIRDKGVYLIAGWSDKIFDVLAAIENGANALDKIYEMEL